MFSVWFVVTWCLHVSTPAIGMEDTSKEYQQWSDEFVMQTSLPPCTTVLNMLEKLMPCETSLVSILATVVLSYMLSKQQSQTASVEAYQAVVRGDKLLQ